MPLDHNYQPRTTHCGLPKFIMGKSHPEVVFWVIVASLTGHHDLSEMINPNPAWLAPQNHGIHLVDRLNSQLIGSYMAMATLHTPSIPPWGLHILIFTMKDRYHQLLLLLSLTVHLYLPQQFYYFHFLSASEPNINTNHQFPQSISPCMLSLSMLWPQMTLQ